MRYFYREWLATFFVAVVLVTAPWLGYSQTGTAAADGSVAISDVTIIDVTTGGHRAGVTVLIRGDRIATIG